MRFDQRPAAAPAPPRQPGERAFGFVDGDLGAAEFVCDLALRQREVAPAEIADLRLSGFQHAGGFVRLGARFGRHDSTACGAP